MVVTKGNGYFACEYYFCGIDFINIYQMFYATRSKYFKGML